jgi:hypothetical protein
MRDSVFECRYCGNIFNSATVIQKHKDDCLVMSFFDNCDPTVDFIFPDVNKYHLTINNLMELIMEKMKDILC